TTGRPGPVVIGIPKNIATSLSEEAMETDFYLPGYQPTTKPNPFQIIKVTEAIANAKRPVILAGAGVVSSGAADFLKEFADNYDLPVVIRLLGLGCFLGSYLFALGMGGMHGS